MVIGSVCRTFTRSDRTRVLPSIALVGCQRRAGAAPRDGKSMLTYCVDV